MKTRIVTPRDVEIEYHHNQFNASWTFEFMKKQSVRGEPLGTGITGSAAIADLIERTSREMNADFSFTDIPIRQASEKPCNCDACQSGEGH